MAQPEMREKAPRQFRVTPELKFEELVDGQWAVFDAPRKPVPPTGWNPGDELWDFPAPSELQLVRLRPESRALLEEAARGMDAVTTATAWGKVSWEACPDVLVRWDAQGKPTFSGKDLSGCWLKHVDLSGLHTTCMNFEFAFCQFTSFAGGVVKRGSFAGASLHGARFTNTKVHEATFAGSNCFGVDFEGADVSYNKWVDPNFGDTGWLRKAHFTGTKRNLLGAPDRPQTKANSEGYAAAGDGFLSAARLAWRTKTATLERHRDELHFLLAELDRLRQIDVTSENWQEFYDSWAMLDDLHSVFTSSASRRAIELLFSAGRAADEEATSARHALGMAKQLYSIRGETPVGLLTRLKGAVGRKLRIPLEDNQGDQGAPKTYFDIVMGLREEVNNINTIIDAKSQFQTWINGAFLSLSIGVTNYFANIAAEGFVAVN